MVTNALLAKIVTEKDKTKDAKCYYCGKKLFECGKPQGNTQKSACVIVSLKCPRCKNLNDFAIK